MLSGATELFDPIRFHARPNPERPGLVAFESSARELQVVVVLALSRIDGWFHSALAGSLATDGALLLA